MRKKRRLKPKTLLLSVNSEKSVARLVAALALTSLDPPDEMKLRVRARELLRLLHGLS